MMQIPLDCTGCAVCVNVCPKGCIELKEKTNGFLYPEIDPFKCIDCGLCEKSCPLTSYNSLHKKDVDSSAYYAYINANDEVRLNSSSGGAFYSLAAKIIEQGGVVFGAMFDKNFEVMHGYVETIDELPKLMGSKYVQSKIGHTYQDVKQFLNLGRPVYFSGTPCQLQG